jgi:hypothetical protein
MFADEYIAKKLNISKDQIENSYVNNLEVAWTFYTEMRSWGVKDVGAYAFDVYSYLKDDKENERFLNMIELCVEYYETDDVDAELIETIIDIDVTEFEVDSEVEDVDDRSMYAPNHIELDFIAKQISVTF